ncbi:hypothetical protein [uncultured Phenylobacterium sp.]|jgi:hypothetical protein|uniref:hypothetical protein n=1 Tax=uncultured Phenylobacterium sp. TaxID=349273 RepID=UPI000BCD286D|nr:hypothetical protein [uncultured Phenylobacterium sp.]OYX33540.1 MAG: hypothetical protein B7Y99_07195 [Caulobacterales bacterium 32-69-10]
MTNVSGTPKKRSTKRGLFAFAVQTLEKEGWTVSRVPRGGKASLRLITRGKESHKVSIRTSQDTWIAFPRDRSGKDGWVTLDEVDYVVAASVNEKANPTEARIHMIPGDEARDRFNRAFAARKAAQHTLPAGRGLWVSLYEKDAKDPVSHVGAGAGLAHPAIGVLNLTKDSLPGGVGDEDLDDEVDDDAVPAVPAPSAEEAALTIPEAKRRLAISLGVPESAIKISIEH